MSLLSSVVSLGMAGLSSGVSLAQTEPADIYGIAALDEDTTVGLDARGRLVRTTDGLRFSYESITTSPVFGLSFVSSTFGTAVGDSGTILRSTNRGATWVSQSSGTRQPLLAVSFVDANLGNTVGYSGTVLRTTDGGGTWTPQDSGTFLNLFGLYFADANNGMAVGDFGWQGIAAILFNDRRRGRRRRRTLRSIGGQDTAAKTCPAVQRGLPDLRAVIESKLMK